MLKNHKIIISLLLIATFSGSILGMYRSKPYSYDENQSYCALLKHKWEIASCPLRMAAIGAPCATILGGVALLYHLMTREESSAKLYMQSQTIYEDMEHKYHHGLALLYDEHLNNINEESELAAVAPRVSRLSFNAIPNDIRLLQVKKDILQRRISRDAHTGNTLVAQMVKLLQNIKGLIEDLEHLNEFWQRHGDYFIAYATITRIATKYQQARENVHDYYHIKKVIMSLAVGGWAQYPYLSFADALRTDLDDLARRITTIYRYPVLKGMAIPLQSELQKLLGNIVAFPEYANELYLKKQHQLEQERIAIEREKAEAERAKAHAMAAHAAAEKAKADAMYQQAAAAREQAQAIKDQTLVQLAQPKPQVHINLQPPAQASPAPMVPHIQPVISQWNTEPQVLTEQASHSFMPEPSAPPLEADAPPSYQAAMFFKAIENITPSALTRLDFHINQLEQQYGSAKDIYMDNLSLMSAALDAKNLDAFNKAQLIDLLKGYGVEPTWADKQRARQMGEHIIIKAVGA